jgi:hypothetical protein
MRGLVSKEDGQIRGQFPFRVQDDTRVPFVERWPAVALPPSQS